MVLRHPSLRSKGPFADKVGETDLRPSISSRTPSMTQMTRPQPSLLLFFTIILGLSELLGCAGGKSDPSPSTPPAPPSIVTVKPGPTLRHARYGHGALLLPDGRVAIVGGADPFSIGLPVCEVLDPQTGQFSDTGSLVVPRIAPALLSLDDGRVLVIGGSGDHGNTNLADIEIWDPSAKTSTWVGALPSAQGQGVMAFPLPDGNILVLGGGGFQNPCLLNPSTWTSTVLTFQSSYKGVGAAMGQLPSGDVVIAGGVNGLVAFPYRWVYRWSTGIFESLEPLASPRGLPASAILKDGRWLVIGGAEAAGQQGLDSIEIYSNAAGPRLAVTSGATGGIHTTANLLPDDRVLIVGGVDVKGEFSNVGMKTTLVYDPTQGKSLSGDLLLDGRWWHTTTRLKDGRILVVGGTKGQGALATTELLTIN